MIRNLGHDLSRTPIGGEAFRAVETRFKIWRK